MNRSSRSPWLECCAFGVLVLVLAVVMSDKFPATSANAEDGYGTPVIAFEMATSKADLIRVFGAEDDPARPGRISDMDRGNRWDYPFLAAYGAFLGWFFVAASRDCGHRGWLVFGALGLFAALADAVENVILLSLTADLEVARHLDLLRYPVWTKFFSLMLAGIGGGVFLVTLSKTVWRILGVLTIVGASTVAVAFASPSNYAGFMGSGIGLAWAIQLVYSSARVIEGSRGQD